MLDDDSRRRIDVLVLPHLDAAYNLARWLARNDADAQDIVQDAFERAMRYIGGFRGDNARSWLLQIVRNTCYSWLKANRPGAETAFDGDEAAMAEVAAPACDEPHWAASRNADKVLINQALAELPVVFREVLILREFEDLAYADIAYIVDAPVGTVMSRLARARGLMRRALAPGARPVLREVPRNQPDGTSP